MLILRKLLVVRSARRALRCLLILLAFAVVYALYASFGGDSAGPLAGLPGLTGLPGLSGLSGPSGPPGPAAKNAPYVFYTALLEALAAHRPPPGPARAADLADGECRLEGNYGLNDLDKLQQLSWHNLRHCYRVGDAQLAALRDSHAAFVRAVDTAVLPRPGSLVDALVERGSRGIVTVGGARYSVLLLTMLAQLRNSGTTLPVEVFIPPSDEGDDEFCGTFAPAHNARCVRFSDVLPPHLAAALDVKSYQIKALALVMSRFEHVLFLDADNFAMKDLDGVFDTDAYRDTGLVVWPDLWRRVTAPAWYDIANVSVDLGTRVRYSYDDVSPVSRYQRGGADFRAPDCTVPFHDLRGTIMDPASESGQMLVDKRRHARTLLLALYYNIHGPAWYYRMFSQGTAGEGDKETFVSAAHALGLPYYQVRTPLAFDGFHHDTKGYQGLGLLQHDFGQDYALHATIQAQMRAKHDEYARYDPDYNIEASFKEPFLKQNGPHHDVEVDVMFLHASFYKFDPWTMYDQDCFKTGNTHEHLRGYRNQRRYNFFDFELFNFRTLQTHLCNKDSAKNMRAFRYLDDKVSDEDWPRMCAYIDEHVQYLEQHPIATE